MAVVVQGWIGRFRPHQPELTHSRQKHAATASVPWRSVALFPSVAANVPDLRQSRHHEHEQDPRST